MKDFCFSIKSIDCGWVIGSIALGDGTIEFYISAAFGDNLKQLLLAALTVCPDRETVGKMINAGFYHGKDFPCNTVTIDEEGTMVEWKIAPNEESSLVHLMVTAERYDKDGNETPVCLCGDMTCEFFAGAIVSGIDAWLREHSLMQYFRAWGSPFPLEEFLTAKAALLHKPLWGSMEEELTLLMTPMPL